jgi:DNA-binding PadR family transcriptional regulator
MATPRPSRTPESFLPLTSVVFDILITLADADQHGYSIMTSVRERTGTVLRPGSLYRALNRLLDDGLIEELDEKVDASVDDERRRYYRLSATGRRVVVAETRRLEAQVRSARAAVLGPRRRS